MKDEHAHRRLDVLDETVKSHDKQLAGLILLVEKNNTMTEQVVKNTQALVDFHKWSKFTQMLILKLTPLAGAIYALYYWIRNH